LGWVKRTLRMTEVRAKEVRMKEVGGDFVYGLFRGVGVGHGVTHG